MSWDDKIKKWERELEIEKNKEGEIDFNNSKIQMALLGAYIRNRKAQGEIQEILKRYEAGNMRDMEQFYYYVLPLKKLLTVPELKESYDNY